MIKYVAGGAAVVVAAIGATYFFVAVDPIAELLNQKWQPISVDQQRQKAIDSSAAALKLFSSANVAAGIDVKTIVALVNPLVKAEGVEAIRVKGDQQLLHLEADFKRAFGPDDVPADFKGRDLVLAMKPSIQGTIALSLGIAGGTPDQASPKLQLKILPAFNSLHIEKVALANKFDATSAADALVFLLNRYASNITAALNEAPILDVSLPTALPGLGDQSGPIKISIPGAPDINASVAAKPIKNPFRLAGVASLVDGEHLVVVARLAPTRDALGAPSPISGTFAGLKTDLLAHLKDGLDVSALPDEVWVSVSKALIADSLTSAFGQAEPCFTAQGPIPTQSFSTTVPLPDENAINCSPSDKCDLQQDERDCRHPPNCTHNHDERDCHGLGKWICEGEKATQNQIYDRDFDRCNAGAWVDDQACELAKGTQNGIYSANKVKCEAAKTAKKDLCEAAKEGLKRISRTGKLANIDVSMGGPASLKICFSRVKVTEDLSHISLTLGIEGGAEREVRTSKKHYCRAWLEMQLKREVVDVTIINLFTVSTPCGERYIHGKRLIGNRGLYCAIIGPFRWACCVAHNVQRDKLDVRGNGLLD